MLEEFLREMADFINLKRRTSSLVEEQSEGLEQVA